MIKIIEKETKYKMRCKKCGSVSLHTEVKGNNTGLYCDDCGAWIKWLNKDELRSFDHLQKSQLPKTKCNIPMPEVKSYQLTKIIAKIKICGVFEISVTEDMKWEKPTKEQIKNLHDLCCIDVELLEDGE